MRSSDEIEEYMKVKSRECKIDSSLDSTTITRK